MKEIILPYREKFCPQLSLKEDVTKCEESTKRKYTSIIILYMINRINKKYINWRFDREHEARNIRTLRDPASLDT